MTQIGHKGRQMKAESTMGDAMVLNLAGIWE